MKMSHKEKKSFSYCMRALHRDIGFLLIGLIMVFSLSGIVLGYYGFWNPAPVYVHIVLLDV
ncbi:MAG: hypothetical protein PHS48_07035 [Bacteroidales bacterium]|nr:hypothetical protein [Bacteroidales bacterium]